MTYTVVFLLDNVQPSEPDADVEPDDNDFEFVSATDVDDPGAG